MTRSAKVIQVVFTEDVRGDGTKNNPCRSVQTLWTLSGKKICEIDPTFVALLQELLRS